MLQHKCALAAQTQFWHIKYTTKQRWGLFSTHTKYFSFTMFELRNVSPISLYLLCSHTNTHTHKFSPHIIMHISATREQDLKSLSSNASLYYSSILFSVHTHSLFSLTAESAWWGQRCWFVQNDWTNTSYFHWNRKINNINKENMNNLS